MGGSDRWAYRRSQIASLRRWSIRDAEAELGSLQCLLVALDGPGGAGKSTLTRSLSSVSKGLVSVVCGDDFYSVMDRSEKSRLSPKEGYERFFDWDQRYDWGLDQLTEWLRVPAQGVVMVDDVYSFLPESREYYGYSIFVDTPKQECLT